MFPAGTAVSNQTKIRDGQVVSSHIVKTNNEKVLEDSGEFLLRVLVVVNCTFFHSLLVFIFKSVPQIFP